MTPTDALKEHLDAVGGTLEPVSIIPNPTSSQIVPPALVLRPDSPWSTPRDDGTYCFDHQRYVAVAVASAASPLDAMRKLYAIWQAVISHLPNGWRFDTVDGLVLDESTGTALLATQIHLSYFNTEALEES